MREASFLLPLDVQWPENVLAHNWAKGQLLATFQGYTATHKAGEWLDRETGIVHPNRSVEYVVAYDDLDWLTAQSHNEAVRLIALTAGRQCGQISVYLKDTNGNVEIVSC